MASTKAGSSSRTVKPALEKAVQHYEETEKKMRAKLKSAEDHKPIHPEYLADLVDEFAADDTIFTVDTGMTTVWAARYLAMNRDRRLIGSFRHGSMANALPQAIGAQCPTRTAKLWLYAAMADSPC